VAGRGDFGSGLASATSGRGMQGGGFRMLSVETVDQLRQFDGQGMPVLSFYMSVDTDPGRREDMHARVSSLVDRVHQAAEDEPLNHETRMSVRADLDRVREALADQHWKPGGMAIFACAARGLYEEVAIPRQVRDEVTVDATPYVRPLLAVLDGYRRACIVVIDEAAARFWEIYQDQMREIGEIRDRRQNQPNDAAEHHEDLRIPGKAGELTERHYRNVAHRLRELFQSGRFDLLIIGGQDSEVPAFASFLPDDLRGRIAGTFRIDIDTVPVAELRRHAELILDQHEQAEQQQLISDVYERLATSGLAAAGIDDCLRAGSVAAVDTLLMLDSVTMPGVVCDQSGWLGRSGDTCPVCGNPTRTTPDVLEELAENVIAKGGSVRQVEAGGRLANDIVAASLRFPLPQADNRAGVQGS
jgi:peptide subunit release factor 1 (eRF1)